jgi:glutamate/tyrosine decarboxylase-like PLP-dependent enzyme
MRLEQISVDWLKSSSGSRPRGRALTTGATMANFTGLAAARRWWGEQHGVDVEEQGLSGLPVVPVLGSGHVHVSAVKALAMLGIGRRQVRTFEADATGNLNAHALERALRELEGSPAILIGNAGEVNAGGFDPIAQMAGLAEEHGAWLHVDGAFGLFAAVTPETRTRRGIDRAPVCVDGHKWLNVPTTAARRFVHARVHQGPSRLRLCTSEERSGAVSSATSARDVARARALAVWATLRAYGRSGYRRDGRATRSSRGVWASR